MADTIRKLAFARIFKVDQTKHEVWGKCTEEVVDSDNQICDYESSKPFFKAWAEHTQEITDGKSMGALREMHQLISAGKVISMEFDDEAKSIDIGTKIVNDSTWEKITEGVLVGFSLGGRAIKVWPDPVLKGVERFTAKPNEISVVDSPACPTALFEFIKADGSSESRKFKTKEGPTMEGPTNTDLGDKLDRVWKELQGLKKSDGGKTKRVAGEDLGPSAFAFVGDSEKTETWKFPLHFSSEEKSKRHVRNALARWSQAKDIPESEKPKVHAKIVAAAKKYGIDVSSESDKAQATLDIYKAMVEEIASNSPLTKSMQNITDLANMLIQMRWVLMDSLWEADYEFGGEGDPRDEAISVEMKALMEHCIEILKDVVEDETSELAATSKAAQGELAMKLEEIQKAANSFADHFKKAAAHHMKMAGLHKAKSEHHTAKAAESMASAGSGMDEMKAIHKAMADSHKFDAEHHMNKSKAHEDYAAHCDSMAAKCMGKADDVADIQKSQKDEPVVTKPPEEVNMTEAQFTKALGDLTKSFTDELGKLKTEVADMVKGVKVGVTAETQTTTPPAGFTLVPRDGEAKKTVNSYNYSATGL